MMTGPARRKQRPVMVVIVKSVNWLAQFFQLLRVYCEPRPGLFLLFFSNLVSALQLARTDLGTFRVQCNGYGTTVDLGSLSRILDRLQMILLVSTDH